MSLVNIFKKFDKEEIFWTKHSKEKMGQYNLSEKRILKVLRKPERKEEGIVPGTIAAMQTVGTKKHPSEIWLMYQIKKLKIKNKKSKIIKIISAWRYPGISPKGQPPPIPKDTLWEIEKESK